MRGGAELVFTRAGGRTILRRSRCRLPLQVQRPQMGPRGEAILTLLCPTGDLLEGDEIELDVICEPGTDVTLRQASATRLHGCGQGDIEYQGHFEVQAGASLRYLPWELIPFAHTRYHQRLQVELAEGGQAGLWEVVGPGRVWEVAAPRCLSLQVDVRVDGAIVLTDVLRLERPNPVATAGHSHLGSLLLLGPDHTQADADRIHDALSGAGLVGSASLLPAYGVGARVLADSADTVFRLFERLVA
jgi:urease accessory protein